jgi:hypothetical protein
LGIGKEVDKDKKGPLIFIVLKSLPLYGVIALIIVVKGCLKAVRAYNSRIPGSNKALSKTRDKKGGLLLN